MISDDEINDHNSEVILCQLGRFYKSPLRAERSMSQKEEASKTIFPFFFREEISISCFENFLNEIGGGTSILMVGPTGIEPA